MHIPDGYLGPITCAAGFVVMTPVWLIASRKVRTTLSARQVPSIAIAAAFSFVIMMFNVPIPGGTSGHAVGSVLAAILLGPWAATIAVTVALVIQALLFGDGGITALGVNCFNMAFVMPFTGYAFYKLISGNSPVRSTRRIVGAGIAGYAGLVVASLCAGVEFGIQPLLHHTAEGRALYCPYGLAVAVPGMVGGHALLFGWIEAIVTLLVVKYLQANDASWLSSKPAAKTRPFVKAIIALVIFCLLSPLGLYLPYKFGGNSAWGEWSAEEIQKLLGYVPSQLQSISSLWTAPMRDYSFRGWETRGHAFVGLAYIASAVIGVGICLILALLLGKALAKKNTKVQSKQNAEGFLERTVYSVVSVLRESVSAERIASFNGFLQHRDPRFKCGAAILFLCMVLMSKSAIPLGISYAALVALSMASKIKLSDFFKRTLPFVPLFSLFVVAPAMLNIVTPGSRVASIGPAGWNLFVTRQGLQSALIVFLRILDSVSLGVLLVLTTHRHVLLKVMRTFGVPRLFVMTLGMTYRYIFLFLDVVKNLFVAIRSRVGFIAGGQTGRGLVAAHIAGTWLRSHRMQSQVYDAMVSRGYAGEAYSLDDFHGGLPDGILLSTALVALIGTLWVNRFFH